MKIADRPVRLILASHSPYRKYAMDLLGLDYEIVPSDIDERSIRDENPRILVEKLSEAKALSVAEKYNNAIIVASDAVVWANGEIYEKPADKDDAFEMLRSLSDNQFEFVTGLAVHNTFTGRKLTTAKSCEIRFRSITDEEIHRYIAHYPVLNCAGAFEHHGLLFFSEFIRGSYNFRTAIPVAELTLFLRDQGIPI
jgi:septum formation protein